MACNDSQRFRAISTPYDCDTCNNAYIVRKDHADLLAHWKALKDAGMELNAEYLETNYALNQAANKLDVLNRHMLQYANQRPFIQKLESDGLEWRTAHKWKILVYEDFVASYNYKKKKVANLVFTIKWRDSKGRLQYKYIDNFCSDNTQSADACYVLTCWQAHLRFNLLKKIQRENPSQFSGELERELMQIESFDGYWREFENVTDIVRTGDNGGHLLNKLLCWFASIVFEKDNSHVV